MKNPPIQRHRLARHDFQRMPPEDAAAFQDRLLRKQLEWCAKKSPFYKRMFKRTKLDVSKIKGFADLERLPFTEKRDLSENNEDFFATSREETADICMTSGTTGDVPTVSPLSGSDVLRLAYNEEVSFALAGLLPSDTLVICAAIDRCFMAGMAYFLGALRIGARTVRAGGGSPAQCWNLMKNCGATAAIGVPSLMNRICEHAAERGENPAEAGVGKILAIGEPLRDAGMKSLPVTKKLEKAFGAKIMSTYASTEMAASLTECPLGKGAHLRPELLALEIIGENGERVPHGEKGEVVATPLGVEGLPLLRFRTGDVSFLIEEPCGCGRTTMRIGPVLGRKNQMLKLKGTTIFPDNILSALVCESFFADGYVRAERGGDGEDRVFLHAALRGPADGRLVAERVRAKLRVAPEVLIEKLEDIERVTRQPEKKRKKVTFVDLRGN